MNLLLHLLPRHQNRHGRRKLVAALFWIGLLWCSALFTLLLLYGATTASGVEGSVGTDLPGSPVALFATSLLGCIATATLVAQMRGYAVPAWCPLTAALPLFIGVWWG